MRLAQSPPLFVVCIPHTSPRHPSWINSNICRVERDGHVLTITIHRPEVLNALHPPAHAEIAKAFDLYAADPDLHVAILTGSGERAFCVGSDLKARALTNRDDHPPTGFAGITKRFDLFKPVIAAINGLCLGGGVEIVAACDLAIAADHAQFGMPEPLVGLAALGGGALQRMARQLPLKEANYLILTGKRITAADARRIGLINEVVPGNELNARAARARRGPASLRAARGRRPQSR